MLLQPAVRHTTLQQDGFRCRKARVVVPMALSPTSEVRADDRAHIFNRYAERFSGQPFGPGPEREWTCDAETLSSVFFVATYVN